MRAFVDEWAQLAPELFPKDFDQGYCLHGFGRESEVSGLKLRKIVLADGTSYWLRPSFVTSSMTGTVDQFAYPFLWRRMVFPVAAEDRFRPQRHVLVSRHRAAGTKQSGGNHRPRRGTVARASGGGRASRTGPARRATSRQPSAAAAFRASR